MAVTNETPEIVSYFNHGKPLPWFAIDHEFYAFTKQVCRYEGVVSVGCDIPGRRFYVRASKDARRSLSQALQSNTWHCADGTQYRIEILPER